MLAHRYVFTFSEIDEEDTFLVGKYAKHLSQLAHSNLPLPKGFVITSALYSVFVRENHLDAKIAHYAETINFDHPESLTEAAQYIQKIVTTSGFSNDIVAELLNSYKGISGRIFDSPVLLSPSSIDTHIPLHAAPLYVTGEANFLLYCKSFFAKQFTKESLLYRYRHHIPFVTPQFALVVQQVISADKSGFLFTVDPLTQNKDLIVVEAMLGEHINTLPADRYEINKSDLTIVSKHLSHQEKKYQLSKNGLDEASIEEEDGSTQKLSDKEICELALLGKKLENITYFPQEAQWVIHNGNIYLNSVRELIMIHASDKHEEFDDSLAYHGIPISPGIATGKAHIMMDAQEEVTPGEILIAKDPKNIPVSAIQQASAIVTDTPMQTSHAQQIYQQFGIPIVSQVATASESIQTGETVTVDGSNGKIHKGDFSKISGDKTAIKVYALTTSGKQAEGLVNAYVNGIVFDPDFIITANKIHPKKLTNDGKEKKLQENITQEILSCKKFLPSHEFIYKFSDLLSSDFKTLQQGNEYETFEHNPLLGYHGIFRHLHDTAAFTIEIEALKKINKKNSKQLSLLLPFIRSVKELEHFKQLLASLGFAQSSHCKYFVEIATPANILQLEEIISAGVDGVIINFKTLTSLTLGADQDNGEVALAFTPYNAAVQKMLQMAVDICKKHNTPVSLLSTTIDGNTLQNLVLWGIDSVIVSPKSVSETKQLLVFYEHKLATYGTS